MNRYEINEINPSGILAEMGVEKGDRLLSINGKPVIDELDIRFLGIEDDLIVQIQKQNGEIWDLEIEKDEGEDLGILCDGGTLGIRRCKNKCIFCFIDQMPPGMRETLYIKDDDERLSFLQGNYVTLTNLSDFEKQRIVDYHIMPINVSIHTTDSKLRCTMLGNRFAGTIMDDLAFFADHHIQMNGQIVLCPGYNDGVVLEKTLTDIMLFYPSLASVSVVPVGMSSFRDGLVELKPVDHQKAIETLDIIGEIQKKMLKKYGTRFVFPGDEFFLMAKKPFPKNDYYEQYTQLENGVGMITDFETALKMELRTRSNIQGKDRQVGIITGILAADFMKKCAKQIESRVTGLSIQVIPVKNMHFGETITVSGLVTGKDILNTIKSIKNIDTYFIPESMIRYGTSDLLDDITLEMLEKETKVPFKIVPVNGASLVAAILDN